MYHLNRKNDVYVPYFLAANSKAAQLDSNASKHSALFLHPMQTDMNGVALPQVYLTIVRGTEVYYQVARLTTTNCLHCTRSHSKFTTRLKIKVESQDH